MALELKAKGNERFREGDYQAAEEFYSQAIQKNSKEPSLFNNRALVRSKLESWAGTEHDARIAIDLYGPKDPAAIKTSYYLAQALLHLQRPSEAFDVALAAYQQSLVTRNPNSEVLSKTILRAKQAIWAAKETARLRQSNETLKSIEELMEADLNSELERLRAQLDAGEIGHVGYTEDQNLLREEADKRLSEVRGVFADALGGDMRERVVPDYLIDNISFEIMHDPVVTPSGNSFDRVSVLKHLQHSPVDPISRVPMIANDLRPNTALKAACEDFLNKNGWAVDW